MANHGGPRPGAGRKASPDKRTTRAIRFSKSEWQQIQSAAAKLNMKPSEYIRAAALQNKEE